ncbi:hypothetical protein D3C78_905810 [compost metagenome]
MLGLEVRVAVARIVEVVEGRRAEAFAVGQDQVVGGVQRQGQGAAPSVLAAELLVLVVAHAQLGGETFALVAVLDEDGLVPALLLLERGVAVELVLVPVGTQQQAVAVAQSQSVQPVHRVAVGVEHAALVAELVQALLAVLAVTDFQAAVPSVVDLRVQIAGDAADGKVAVRGLADGLEGGHVEAAEGVVELGAAALVEHVHAGLDAVVEAVAQAQAEGLVAVSVVVLV